MKIEILIEDIHDAVRAHDAIETLLRYMGQVGTLSMGPVPAEKPVNTKRVRVLVAIDDRGEWSAFGSHHGDKDSRDRIFIDDLHEHTIYRWVEADVPIPTEETIEGDVSE